MATIAVRSLVLSVSLTTLAFSGPPARQDSTNPSLTAHEWGTFTSIADRSGKAVRWLPLNGSDLPQFVEHFRTAEFKVGLSGTVRMETPVLYFYSPTETTLSVGIGFSRGVITEWYPHASHIEPNPKKVLGGEDLFTHNTDGSIAWDSVTVAPGLAASFPRGDKDSENHYYAARETSAAPLTVRTTHGTQQEKFLFYRGVSVFPVPVSAQSSAEGKVLVKNLGSEEIPGVILFERRGDKLGYRLGGALQGEATLDPPELTSTLESMSRDLEGVLIGQGLYPDEARAMVETWRESWFEEGSRLLYIVPTQFVNGVLPLSINPGPGQVVRVFVGRLELISPATERAVETALAAHDLSTIEKYGRFLQPIMEQLEAENPARARQLEQDLMKTYGAELAQPQSKCSRNRAAGCQRRAPLGVVGDRPTADGRLLPLRTE
jgi:hypothetical protein